MTIPSLKIGNKTAKYALVQGGMSVRIALHRLVAAVANAGGVGTIGGMAMPVDELRQEIRKAREAARGIIGVNLMYAGYLFDKLLDAAIAERVDFVAVGAGFARGPFRKLAQAGIPGLAIISSEKAARLVSRTEGVYGVVVESGQAGGHLGPKDPEESIWELFPRVLKALRESGMKGPVIAAGGLLTRRDFLRALEMGADGVQMGTRFAVSQESAASEAMKKAWVNATGSQVQSWSPTGLLSRAIVPHTADKLPKLGPLLKCQQCLKRCLHRDEPSVSHCIRQALVNAQQGDVEHGLVFSGSRIGEIKDIPTVKEIFSRLVGSVTPQLT